jgi:2-haloacid dehalogenase
VAERAVDAVLFDVNETLFSLAPLGPAFAEVGLDPAAVPLWFARLLRDGFALAAMGDHRPFADLAADSLQGINPQLDDEAVGRVLGAFRAMPAHPDVEPALRLLHGSGVPALTLTNSSVDAVQGLLAGAGLAGYVRENLSADTVRRWKPAPEPYRHAADHLGVEPQRLVLVAAHPWDCAGAQAAGLRSAWINRAAAPWPRVYPAPTATDDNLPALITTLLNG